jgi:hypothetical protein
MQHGLPSRNAYLAPVFLRLHPAVMLTRIRKRNRPHHRYPLARECLELTRNCMGAMSGYYLVDLRPTHVRKRDVRIQDAGHLGSRVTRSEQDPSALEFQARADRGNPGRTRRMSCFGLQSSLDIRGSLVSYQGDRTLLTSPPQASATSRNQTKWAICPTAPAACFVRPCRRGREPPSPTYQSQTPKQAAPGDVDAPPDA